MTQDAILGPSTSEMDDSRPAQDLVLGDFSRPYGTQFGGDVLMQTLKSTFFQPFTARLNRLRKNALYEGHGFSRAVNVLRGGWL